MKKVILLFLITAVMFSCKKNETTQPADQYAEVSFNVTTLVPDAGREWTFDVPECDPEAIPGHVLMAITDADGLLLEGGEEGPNQGVSYFKALVFYTNGELYTQSIKLPVTDDDDDCQTYWVTEFYMYDEEGDLIKAAPYPGDEIEQIPPSEFFQFVTQPLPVELTICAFTKTEFYIDVLCFTPDYYQLFGFFWFEITEITVREICFYGDVCQAWWMDPSDWHTEGVPLWVWEEYDNLYQDQQMGIQQDMPAIFTLLLGKETAPGNGQYLVIGEFNNDDFLGEGEPLCFRYADYDAIEGEQFGIFLFVYGPWYYAPVGRSENFGYTINATRDDVFDVTWPGGMWQHIWFFTDNALEDLDTGYPDGDGVIEFGWGDCVENPEYLLPGPWTNSPYDK